MHRSCFQISVDSCPGATAGKLLRPSEDSISASDAVITIAEMLPLLLHFKVKSGIQYVSVTLKLLRLYPEKGNFNIDLFLLYSARFLALLHPPLFPITRQLCTTLQVNDPQHRMLQLTAACSFILWFMISTADINKQESWDTLGDVTACPAQDLLCMSPTYCVAKHKQIPNIKWLGWRAETS